MHVPSSLLRQKATVEPYEGSGGNGPIYGPPIGVRGRLERSARTVRRVAAGSDVGTDVVSSARFTTRPGGPAVPALSRLTVDGYRYEVLDVQIGEGLTKPAYVDLMLGDSAP